MDLSECIPEIYHRTQVPSAKCRTGLSLQAVGHLTYAQTSSILTASYPYTIDETCFDSKLAENGRLSLVLSADGSLLAPFALGAKNSRDRADSELHDVDTAMKLLPTIPSLT